MTFLARVESMADQAVALPVMMQSPATTASFSALEWSIIRLARNAGLATIREPGPLRRFYHWLIGRNASRRLANERLEALRRIAVLGWHFGSSVPSQDVADFLSAGFTPEQYELLVSSTRVPKQLRTISGEVLA